MITQELICNKSCQRDCGNCVSACLAFSYPRRFPQVANRKLWIVYYLQVNFGSNLPFEVNIYILFKSNLSIRQRVSEETQEILMRSLGLQRWSSGWIRLEYCYRKQGNSCTYSSRWGKLISHNTYMRQRLTNLR